MKMIPDEHIAMAKDDIKRIDSVLSNNHSELLL